MKGRFRYWGWLALKISAATLASAGLYVLFNRHPFERVQPTFDAVLFRFWILPMVWTGLLWLCLADQRFRCRTCARRLRMPVKHGSYASLLLRQPSVEYICPYGHGKLLIDVRLSDRRPGKWTVYGSIWQELSRQEPG